MSDVTDFTAALAEAARTINRPQSMEETLETIARTARDNVPGFEEVGISLMHSDGKVETMAATGDLVWRLDALQYDLRDGPRVSSLHEEPALRLYVDENGTIGGINMYSTGSEDIEEHAPQLAQVFAAQAAVALGHAQEVHHLNAALASRQAIGQAVGILIERYKLDEQAAFSFLVRLSSHSNTKLRDVASRLVADTIASGERTE